MSNLYIQEAFANKTRGERYGETPVYETFTDDTGPLYRSLQSDGVVPAEALFPRVAPIAGA